MAGPELRVSRLWRYPVKSMQGEERDFLDVVDGHVESDRQWAVVEVETGFTLSAKRHGVLLECHAAIGEGPDTIVTLPSGSSYEAGTPEADAALGEALGREVAIRRPEPGSSGHLELMVDPLDEGSEILSMPLPDRHFADLADFHLLTSASLAAAATLHPAGDWDVRRFRPTALIEGAEEGFPEDAWVGSTVRLGSAVTCDVFMPTVRCSLPPRAQPGLPRDNMVVRVLKDHHDMSLGVYAAGRQSGRIRSGDAVVVGS